MPRPAHRRAFFVAASPPLLFVDPSELPVKKTLQLLCGVLSAAALFAIMALTFFDVIGRKAVSQSIPGSLELTELLMVVVIFAALPLVSERGEHVVFDSMDGMLSAAALKLQKAVVHVMCATAMLGLGWLMWRTGHAFVESGETTAQLKLLKAPFVYGMGVMCAVTGLVHAALVFNPPVDLAEGEGVAL
jgi:TRAP-type transport system small permease protein